MSESIQSTVEETKNPIEIIIVGGDDDLRMKIHEYLRYGGLTGNQGGPCIVTDEEMLNVTIVDTKDYEAVSDGYHTFEQLYAHRHALYIAMVSSNPQRSWFSEKHHDGSSYDGWILVGMTLPSGQISYHLPNEYIGILNRYRIRHLERAPEWDGHSSDDVVNRIHEWIHQTHSIPKVDNQMQQQTQVYDNGAGLIVNALSGSDPRADGRDMNGHVYQVVYGAQQDQQVISFQQGPVPTSGVNGVTNETLLAITIHRTELLNEQFPCEENEIALEHMRAALRSFEARTAKRIARGVEGKEIK